MAEKEGRGSKRVPMCVVISFHVSNPFCIAQKSHLTPFHNLAGVPKTRLKYKLSNDWITLCQLLEREKLVCQYLSFITILGKETKVNYKSVLAHII